MQQTKENKKQPLSVNHFSSNIKLSWKEVLLALIKSSFTVFYVRAPLHSRVADKLRSKKQLTGPSLEKELNDIKLVLDSKVKVRSKKVLKQKESILLFATLMQFTSPVRELQRYSKTHYSEIDLLYRKCKRKSKKHPLSVSAQLTEALGVTGGDLQEALWLLFITSRQFARWYDSESIIDLPNFSTEEILDNMFAWSVSTYALKPYNTCPYQDSAGDNYYVWTHVIGKVAFTSLSSKYSILSKLEALALHFGTTLNHKLAHKVKPQSVSSDHTIAAKYGNEIGAIVSDFIRESS